MSPLFFARNLTKLVPDCYPHRPGDSPVREVQIEPKLFFRLNHFVEGATIRASGFPAIFSYWNVNLGV